MAEFIVLSEIVESNGRTIRQNNCAIEHRFKVGTLVEVKYDNWFGEGACEKVHARLWIVTCGRDCDGTPIYWCSRWKDAAFAKAVHAIVGGFSEDALTPLEVTLDRSYGTDALQWE